MKFIKKAAAVLIAVLMTVQIPFTAYASQKTGCIFNTKTYTHQTKFDKATITQGIDVSYHNSTINFKKVKNAGVDFVIMRVGYRGYGSSGSLNADKNFTTYIKDAQAAGLPVGVYFYSQAISTTEAKEEANYVLSKIKSYKIQLPVIFDYEFAEVSTGRLDSAWKSGKLNKTKMTNIAMAFCKAVEDAGYEPMVYANKSFFTDQLDHAKIEQEYGIWLAHYTTSTNYTGEYDIWQFSSTGRISGITGDVDANFMYTSQTTLEIADIASKVYTGSAIKPTPTVTCNGEKLVKDTDYTVTYKNNVEIGKATITVKGKGDYAGLSQTKNFNIVPVKSTGIKMTSRGINSISLKWDKTPQATGYRIQVYRSTGWQVAGYATGTTFTVKDLASASNYSFRVSAYKTVNGVNYYGAYSSAIKHATKPAKVTDLKADSATTTSITLSWKRQAGATRYQVYKYSAVKKKYVLYKELTSSASTSLKVTSLKPNTPYGFKVRAIKDGAEGVTLTGEFSSILSTATKPTAPEIKTASSPSSKKLKVTYSKVPCSGYQVRWSTTKDFSSNYKSAYVTSSSTLSKTVTASQSKKTYYVKVRAYRNVNGTKLYSSWSKTLKVVTK